MLLAGGRKTTPATQTKGSPLPVFGQESSILELGRCRGPTAVFPSTRSFLQAESDKGDSEEQDRSVAKEPWGRWSLSDMLAKGPTMS